MQRAIHIREERRRKWKKEGERSTWQNLSMVGVLGWLIVTPTVLGVFVGRLLDQKFDTGILFSGALILFGIALGSYLAWLRITKE